MQIIKTPPFFYFRRSAACGEMGSPFCDVPCVGSPYTTYTTIGKGRVREIMACVVLAIIWGLLGMSVPTLAASCSPSTNSLIVEPGSGPNLEAVFNCEDGDFEVFWSGEVSVPGTIFIGYGTTVKIYGENTAINASSNSLSGTTVDSSSSSSSDQQDQQLKELSSGMSLPTDISAAAVGSSDSGGPIFHVDGGQIVLNALAVRNGYVDNGSGGGVYANNSDVTIIDCLFENNFASDQGGGVFAILSTLAVANSTFRGNSAGFEPLVGDDDGEGAGGGIAVRTLCRTRLSNANLLLC